VRISPTKPTSSEGKKAAIRLKEKREAFHTAMNDDFNSALALAKIFEGTRELNRFLKDSGESQKEKAKVAGAFMDLIEPVKKVFGILEMNHKDWFTSRAPELPLPVEEIEELIKKRQEAREHKNWSKADNIRKELKEKGILLEDTPKGTVWRLV